LACSSACAVRAEDRAVLSLTLQVTHQSAVKLTRTGRPSARAAFTACSDHGWDDRREEAAVFSDDAAGALPASTPRPSATIRASRAPIAAARALPGAACARP